MNRIVLTLAILGGFTGSIRAQDLHADIPFAFHVGASELPAGEYRFSASNSAIRVLPASAHGSAALAVTFNADAPNVAKPGLAAVQFNRYGDQYFLSKVWNGRLPASSLMKTNGEKQAARLVESKITTIALHKGRD